MHRLNLNNIFALLFSILVALALTAHPAFGQAEVGTNDLRITEVGTNGSVLTDARTPAIAYDSNNNLFLVVWSADEETGGLAANEFEIYGQFINASTGANTGSKFRISTQGPDGDNNFNAIAPAVAFDSDTNIFFVVWQGDRISGEKEIYGRRIASVTGATIGSAVRISDMGLDGDTATDAFLPRVVYNSNQNEFLVIWRGEENDSDFEIFGQRLTSAGVEVGSNDFQISASNLINPSFNTFSASVAFNSTSSEYLVVWSGDAEVLGAREVYGVRLNSGGIQQLGIFLVSDTGPANDSNYDADSPDVTYNSADDEFLVVWRASDNTGALVDGEFEIYGQRIEADGDAVGLDDFRISTVGADGNADNDAGAPKVAFDSVNEAYMVAWEADVTNSEFEIYVQVLGSSGAKIGDPGLRISDMGPDGSTAYQAFDPALAFGATNEQFLVVWEGDDDTAPLVNGEEEVFGQLLAFPEIEVDGNGVDIANNDATPSLIDHTDFGVISVDSGLKSRTYAIFNSGPAALRLTADPVVKISGAHAADFSVSTSPSTSISSETGTILRVVFNPSASGLRTATISIDTSDLDESTFSFNIQGTGGDAVIEVYGNGNEIPNADISPSELEGTDFLAAPIGFPISRTYTIRNAGDAELSLGGFAAVTIDGVGSDEFSVTSGPARTIPSGMETTFTVEFISTETIFREVTVSIPNNDISRNPFTFNVSGKGVEATDTDGDGIPDALDLDDDNDGVSDVQEMSDGSDSLDIGSVIEKFGTEVCIEWNGFLGFLTQVLELRNTSSDDITVAVSLFNISGEQESIAGFDLAPGIQRDIIVNDLAGFEQDTYGLICANIVTGPAEALGGQLVTYRFTDNTYTLAYKSEFLPARFGKQYFTYNTFQPSLNPADQGNFVANWVQLVNDEDTEQAGTLRYYDSSGVEVKTIAFGMGPKERRDIDIHSLGAYKTGLVVWEPDSATALFRMRQNRYYYGAGGIDDLIEAVTIPSKRGSGEILLSPFDTRGRTVALEISNASDTDLTHGVIVYDQSGAQTPDQPGAIFIPARGTVGIVLNEYLASGFGNVAISSDLNGTLLANIVEYGRSESGALLYANASSLREALGSDLRGSYNSFLGQSCRLRLSSFSRENVEAAVVNMTRFDGTVLLSNSPLAIPQFGSVELDLCSNEDQQAYGEIQVISNNPKAVVGEVVRTNAEGRIEFGGALLPQ